MQWKPPEKFIRELSTIRVNQELRRGGNDVVLPARIEFEWEDFLLSVTRTRSMRMQIEGMSLEDRDQAIYDYGFWTAGSMNVCIDKTTQEFSFTKILYNLPDDERPSVAGNVGAAVADLIMEKLGFYWRANAGELKLEAVGGATADTKRTPDYVYDPGKQHGFEEASVVVVEAKGSLSPKKAEIGPIKSLARRAYKRQVQDFIETESNGLFVASGYSVAFGAIPGTQTSRIAIASPQKILTGPRPVWQPASLSSAAIGGGMLMPLAHAHQAEQEQLHVEQAHEETAEIETGRGGRGRGGDGGERRGEGERAHPSGRIAFANYENAFLLCGARNASAFLRRILSGDTEGFVDGESLIQGFWLIELPEPILVGETTRWRPIQFGIYEPSVRTILESAARNRLSPPAAVEIAIAPTEAGRDLRGREGLPRREAFMQGDGLALFWQRVVREAHYREWDLSKGGWL
jgi:hypothetical protein